MTPNVDSMYDAQSYIGTRLIVIGDGKVLKITHIGTCEVSSTDHSDC